MTLVKVPGRKVGEVLLYALSTCGWCQKTKKLLEEMGVEYAYIYVDHLDGEELRRTKEDIRAWNPACSFPTLVIDNKRCIVGFREDEIREVLG